MRIPINLVIMVSIFAFIYYPIFNTGNISAISFVNMLNWASLSAKKTEIKSPNSGIPNVYDSEVNIQSAAKSSNYAKEMVAAWSNTSFNVDNFEKIKKNKDGRPLTLEELAKQAEIIGMSDELAKSIEAWKYLDERTIDEFKKMPINKNISKTHKSVIAWYKYHANFAGKLANINLSKTEIKKINNEYFKNADRYLPPLQRKLSEVIGEPNHLAFLFDYFIKNAKAFAGVPDFGGKILSYSEICITGFSFYVFGNQGGWFWIYYATMPIGGRMVYAIVPGGQILGKTVPVPGICTRILVDAHPSGAATVWYYGSSL